MSFLFSVLWQLLAALPTTLLILGTSACAATLVAVGLAWLAQSTSRLLRGIQIGWTFLFRGTPLLLQIFLIYYGLPMVGWIRHGFLWLAFRDPVFCACFAMTCCCSAYIGEVLRGALGAVPRGEVEAARACGMTRLQIGRRILGPSMVRYALPSYTNEIIMMAKSTSLASTITVMDITGVAQQVIAHSYRTLDVFCCAALLYLLITGTITAALLWAERRLGMERSAVTAIATPEP